jgi:hypothetical protein
VEVEEVMAIQLTMVGEAFMAVAAEEEEIMQQEGTLNMVAVVAEQVVLMGGQQGLVSFMEEAVE